MGNQDKKPKKQELTPEEKNAFNQGIFSWTAHLYRYHEKTKRWYISAGLFMLILIGYAIYTEAYTFAVALLAYCYVYVYFHSKEPNTEKIIISEIGIKEGKHYYPYSSIKHFWIIYHPPFVKQLHIMTNKRVMPEVVIQLEDQDPAELRNYLCHQIPELEGKEEGFVDTLIRTLKL